MSSANELRLELHRRAEPSDKEKQTAATILRFLSEYSPDEIIDGIGGHGLAAIYNSARPGKTILVRAELDALPIDETLSIEHGSKTAGVSHKCGHDGHMAIVAGLATLLNKKRPLKGRVVLLFQPAEETGQGAARVLADPKFAAIEPDFVFALHNLPGFAVGSVILKEDEFASASRGMIVELEGKTAHAGEPQKGVSPALAMAHLVQAFSAVPQFQTNLFEDSKVTVIHARLGSQAFGTSPGDAEVMATLRATSDDVVKRISKHCTELATRVGDAYQLKTKVSWTEQFPVTTNHLEATQIVHDAAKTSNLNMVEPTQPFAWSEDFGHFTAKYPGALFGLGAGENHPALHNPDYDFPDVLLNTGIDLFAQIIRTVSKG